MPPPSWPVGTARARRRTWPSAGSGRSRWWCGPRTARPAAPDEQRSTRWSTPPTRRRRARTGTSTRTESTGGRWSGSTPGGPSRPPPGGRNRGTAGPVNRTPGEGTAVKKRIEVAVNGARHVLEIDTRSTLVDMLRDSLRLTGAHVGCATGNCGACTVMLNGRTVKSCCILAADVDGENITTIEALSSRSGELHPIQEAFVEHQ